MAVSMSSSNLLQLAPIILSIASLLQAAKISRDICPPFPFVSVNHGNINVISEQKYTFHCDKGYFLASPSMVKCSKGKWTSENPPKCLRNEGECNDPPKIPNGEVLGDARHEGSVVQYMCHPGFLLVGEGSRTCLRSGHWDGITPACMAENEPLVTVAERIKDKFVTEVGSHSADSVVPQPRMLDVTSILKGLELVVLIDRSSSIDPKDFRIGIDFVKFLFSQFGIRNGNNTNGTRAAVVTFGSEAKMIFNLDNETISSPQVANAVLDTLQAGGGGTALVAALFTAVINVERHLKMRPRAKRALFLLTDGEPNIGSEHETPEDYARQLKASWGFEIFTLGIGRSINRRFLSDMASSPLLSHVFILDRYADLADIIRIIKDRPPNAPAVSPEKCGHVKREKDYLKEWSWLAALYVGLPRESDTTRLGFCTGILICKKWVLTAASCFYHIEHINDTAVDVQMNLKEVFVVLGEQLLTGEEPNQINFYAMDVRIHPGFDPLNDLKDNLAMVKLNKPAPIDRFRPVCLPPEGRTVPLHLDLTINASISGWGLPPMKGDSRDINGGTVRFGRSSTLVSLSAEGECQRLSGRQKHIFCAGQGLSSCIGDLGSPILAMDSTTNLHHVLGILAGKSHCKTSYNQYTDLLPYVPWINEQTDGCHMRHLMA